MNVYLGKIYALGKVFYNLIIFVYSKIIFAASFFNAKAKKWVEGRLIFPGFNFSEKTIWMHCASLGEFEQGRPVLESLKKSYPNYKIVLSFYSPSGYEVRKNYPVANEVIYLPVDTEANAAKLVQQINPALVIWVKYEFWFHYLAELKKKNVPVLLISGIFRKGQPFFNWYGGIWKKIIHCFDVIFVQNQSSAILVSKIVDQEKIIIAGDTRFDRVTEIANHKTSIDSIEKFIGNKKVLVAGSTWKEDETLLHSITEKHPELLFIIVPHEVNANNINRIQQLFGESILFSELKVTNVEAKLSNILIIDSIGLLSSLYQYADITYVGGGFNKGIHNILEAAVYGKPVIFGPKYEKFSEALSLIELEGAVSIKNADELRDIVQILMNSELERQKMSKASLKFVHENTGATELIVNYIIEKRLLHN
jgi:3-deoxy-D-manno-octulosonic-acid transferase